MGLNILLVLLYFVYLGLTIVMIVFLCFDSKPANKYGESPKYPSTIKNQPVTSETPEKACTSEHRKHRKKQIINCNDINISAQ